MEVAPFDHQAFLDDVVSTVLEVFEGGQIEMEKQAEMVLPETSNSMLKEKLKDVFQKARENVEDTLHQWRVYCANTLFSIPSCALTLEKSWNRDFGKLITDEGAKELELDHELEVLRAQLSTAQTERLKLEAELQSLEQSLRFKKCEADALNDALHVLGVENFHTIQEIARAAHALEDRLNKIDPFGNHHIFRV